MRRSKDIEDASLLGSLVISAFYLFIIIGWGFNVYKFANSDFEEPYKTEIIRGVGVPVFLMGTVLGCMTIGDEEE